LPQLIEPAVHISSKSVRKAAATTLERTLTMLFSWSVHASSVKLAEPVHTVASGVAASRITYLECIRCEPAAIAFVATFVPAKWVRTNSAVPGGAGSAWSLANVAAPALAGLPASNPMRTATPRCAAAVNAPTTRPA